MPSFKQNKIAILDSFSNGDLTDEEFMLLYDINKSTNLELPYWDYEKFDLDRMNDDKCGGEFR